MSKQTEATLEIPHLTRQLVTVEAFRAACAKLWPKDLPKYAVNDVVLVETTLKGVTTPALIIGVEPRDGGWLYYVVQIRSDATAQRGQIEQSRIVSLAEGG